MSALRDVRLLTARHLDLPQNLRAGILDVMNLLDADLDAQGYQDCDAVIEALARLNRIILGEDDEVLDDDEDLLFDEGVSLEALVERIAEESDDDEEG